MPFLHESDNNSNGKYRTVNLCVSCACVHVLVMNGQIARVREEIDSKQIDRQGLALSTAGARAKITRKAK